jgi:hypothetical protein
MTQPVIASAIPTLIAVAILGIRTFQMMALLDAVPPPKIVLKVSAIESPEEPTDMDSTNMAERTSARDNSAAHFPARYLLYSPLPVAGLS